MAAKKAAARKKAAPPRTPTPPETAPSAASPAATPAGSKIDDVRLTMTIELGRTKEALGSVQEYMEQSLVELDKTVGEPVDVLLNGELWARGEVVTVGENFGVRVVEVVRKPGA